MRTAGDTSKTSNSSARDASQPQLAVLSSCGRGLNREESMLAKLFTAAAVSVVLALSGMAFAQQQFGTAAEAKAMLMKAVAAAKADKAKALDMFAKGEGGFLDRDLYPFCFNNTDGKIHPFANPHAKALFGQDERTVRDAAGKPFGQEIYDAAQKPEGQITKISYVFSKPGHP